MKLDKALLDSNAEIAELASDHGGNLDARGSYNTLDFVVRLRPDLHRILEESGSGIDFRNVGSWEAAHAASTYLHETIHWWQHVGTTSGLMLSFLQPAHAHMNRQSLNQVLTRHGAIKPLVQLAEQILDEGAKDEDLNRVLNNWNDLEFFRKLVISPGELVEQVSTNPYFLSVGHSYQMAIGATSWLIAATLDPNYEVLPHPRDWEDAMTQLRLSSQQGFYKGSPIEVPPLGAKHIFEGQACFSQLQYLYGASGGKLSWDEIRSKGMLSGVYGHAFSVFLTQAEEEWPATADDPIVGLFLLICDLALSPSEGLLLPMTDPSALIWSTDPAWRFLFLCGIAKDKGYEFKRSIQKYSADEYWHVSEILSSALLSPGPREIATTVVGWADHEPSWKALVEEDRTFEFQEGNFPIRVLLAKFIRFQRDKLDAPHFFCWPGMCMTTYRQPISEQVAITLFNEHQALFLNRADLDVYPRLLPGKSEVALQRLVDDFFMWVSTYEMTRQWIEESGSFDYDYGWLTSKFSTAETKTWADASFEKSSGAHPDQFKVLS